MSYKLSTRQLRSLERANAKKVQRLRLKELRQQRLTERPSRPPPRRKDWWDHGDDRREEVERRAAPARRRPALPVQPRPAAATGTVIEVRSGDSLVMYDGRVVRAILSPASLPLDPLARSPLAVGDRAELARVDGGLARIVGVLPRRSALTRDVSDPSRRDGGHQSQVLAANIDQVVIVCSVAQPPFRPRLIDRYLVAASRQSLPALTCANKTDLGPDGTVERYLRRYGDLGVPVLRTSARTGEGLEGLRACLAGKVSLATGHSGVGKSSLLNALEPGLGLKVGGVTQTMAGQGKGRHTTSSARLLPLSMPDTFVVDTPGIRALGIRGLAPQELAAHFADIAAVAEGCLYGNCLHRGEAGCAVAAEARGDWFLRERLESYRGLLSELR